TGEVIVTFFAPLLLAISCVYSHGCSSMPLPIAVSQPESNSSVSRKSFPCCLYFFSTSATARALSPQTVSLEAPAYLPKTRSGATSGRSVSRCWASCPRKKFETASVFRRSSGSSSRDTFLVSSLLMCAFLNGWHRAHPDHG